MKVIQAKPPMFEEINATFNIEGKKVFFTWGDTIFNPSGEVLPPSIIVHEEVHMKQQGDHPNQWWIRYCADKAFRLDQELEAHRAEFQFLCRIQSDIDKPVKGYRSLREFYLIKIAQKLASPIYNNMITISAAKRAIAA